MVAVNEIVELFALKVRLVAPFWLKAAAVEERVQVPFPIFKVLVPAPVLTKLPPIVTLLLLVAKSKVPVKALIVSDSIDRLALLTVTVPPPDDPSKVTSSLEPGTD